MAITNAQQYQQLVNKPGNGKRPGYKGSDWGPGAGSPGTTKSGGNKNKSSSNKSSNNNVSTGNNREDYITNYVSRGAVKGGGEKKKGAVDNNNDGRDDRTGKDIYDEKIVSGDEVKRGRSNFREQFNNYLGGSRPMSLSERNSLRYQNRIFNTRRNNIINQLNQSGLLTPELLKELEEDKKLYDRNDDDKITIDDLTVENLRDKFQVSDDTKGADYGKRSLNLDALTGIKSIQDYVNEGFYKKDGVFDKNSDIYDKDRIPKPFNEIDVANVKGGLLTKGAASLANFLGEKMAGPLTQEYLNKQFNELGEISSLNYKDDTSIKGLMEKYEPNRFKLENPEPGGRDDTPTDPCLGPNPPAYCFVNQDPADPTPKRNLGGLAPRFAGSIFDFTGLANGGRAGYMDGGMMEDTPTGGIMDLETGRQMYFLGKLVKKAKRAVKKVVKSPLGKAALLGGAMYFGGGGKGLASFFGKGSFNPLRMAAAATSDGPMTQLSPLGKILSKFGMATGEGGGKLTLGGKIGLGFGLPFALDALGVGKEEEDNSAYEKYMKDMRLDIPALRGRRNLAAAFDGSTYNYEAYADGGRTGYAEGSEEPVAKKTMPLLDMDGQEKDYRETGGFVDMGRMERADDVPARLSKNEFVFTADAVRNAGEGDIDKGAEVMYNMMKNLEAGGEVSEESQGLEGAREMFQTSQRLGEVI